MIAALTARTTSAVSSATATALAAAKASRLRFTKRRERQELVEARVGADTNDGGEHGPAQRDRV